MAVNRRPQRKGHTQKHTRDRYTSNFKYPSTPKREKRRILSPSESPKRLTQRWQSQQHPNLSSGLRVTKVAGLGTNLRVNASPAQPPEYFEHSGDEPSARWYLRLGTFHVPPWKVAYWTPQEASERRRCARIDFHDRDVSSILQTCERIRGNFWRCEVDRNTKFMVGSRNYIVTLRFDDGEEWLLKTSQPALSWSQYAYAAELLDGEIASMIWVADKTSIPVPQIKAWDVRTTTANRFGKPWYVMKKVVGSTIRAQKRAAREARKAMQPEAAKVYLKKTRERLWGLLARFSLEYLEHEFEKKGRFVLARKAQVWDESMSRTGLHNAAVQVRVVTTTEEEKNHNFKKWCLERFDELQALYYRFVAKDYMMTDEDFQFSKASLQTIKNGIENLIDLDMGEKFYLAHNDYTEQNALCDPDFYITGIIDWEVARIYPLQLAATIPESNPNDFFEEILDLIEKLKEKHPKDSIEKLLPAITEEWDKIDNIDFLNRSTFIESMAKIDTSVFDGDALDKTPWNSGDKYITDVFAKSYAVQFLTALLDEPELLLNRAFDKDARKVILAVIVSIIQAALDIPPVGSNEDDLRRF